MSTIRAHALRRTFTVWGHHPGLLGALRNLAGTASRTVDAVDGVDFEIGAGEFVGYVGPNGAGKSTTLKMLTGILAPTSGELGVCGLEPHRDRKRLARRIGVVFGQRTQLWWDLPPREGFALLGRIYEVPRATLAARLDRLSARFGLGDLLDVPVRKLSLGEKMRCELAAVLLHDPEVLFLDEPTIGLDVVVKDQVRAALRELNRDQGTTVLLTSHDLDDIERLCTRVMVIDRGRLLHDGDLASLRGLYGHRRRLVVDLADAPETVDLPGAAEVTGRSGRRVTISFDPDRLPAPALIGHLLARHTVTDLAVHESRIEDVVKRIMAS